MVDASEFKIGEVVEITCRTSFWSRSITRFLKLKERTQKLVGRVDSLDPKFVLLIGWDEQIDGVVKHELNAGGLIEYVDIISIKHYEEKEGLK